MPEKCGSRWRLMRQCWGCSVCIWEVCILGQVATPVQVNVEERTHGLAEPACARLPRLYVYGGKRYGQKQTMSCRSQREERGDSDVSHRKRRWSISATKAALSGAVGSCHMGEERPRTFAVGLQRGAWTTLNKVSSCAWGGDTIEGNNESCSEELVKDSIWFPHRGIVQSGGAVLLSEVFTRCIGRNQMCPGSWDSPCFRLFWTISHNVCFFTAEKAQRAESACGSDQGPWCRAAHGCREQEQRGPCEDRGQGATSLGETHTVPLSSVSSLPRTFLKLLGFPPDGQRSQIFAGALQSHSAYLHHSDALLQINAQKLFQLI